MQLNLAIALKYILFVEQSKKLGEAWKSLSKDEKKRFEDAAATAKAEFVEKYGASALKRKKETKKDLSRKDDAKPAAAVQSATTVDGGGNDEEEIDEELNEKDIPPKPLTGYLTFSNEVRPRITGENPDANPKQMVSEKKLYLQGFQRTLLF